MLGDAADGCKEAVELPGLVAVGRGALEQTGEVFLGLVVLGRECDPGFTASGAVTQRLNAFEYVRALGRELGNAGAVLVGEGAFAEFSCDTAEGVVKRNGGEWRCARCAGAGSDLDALFGALFGGAAEIVARRLLGMAARPPAGEVVEHVEVGDGFLGLVFGARGGDVEGEGEAVDVEVHALAVAVAAG